VPPERLAIAVEAKLANAEQPDDDANVHNASQCVAVAVLRNDKQCCRSSEAIGCLGRGKPGLRRRLLAAKQPAMRLSAPEPALGEPPDPVLPWPLPADAEADAWPPIPPTVLSLPR